MKGCILKIAPRMKNIKLIPIADTSRQILRPILSAKAKTNDVVATTLTAP
jgi:hypothetical protein